MANIRRNPNSNVGKSPTASQKLIHVANKLKLGGLADQQGSSVNIVDTVLIATNTGRQTLSFFNNCGSKAKTFSNFQSMKLPAGGSLLMQEVTFIYLLLTNNDLTSEANVILGITPLSGVAIGLTPMQLGLMTINIANAQVVSDYQIHETNPSWNGATTGIAANSATPMGPNKIRLEAPPVLPPDQPLKLDLSIPAITAPAFAAVMCIVGRFGSLYAPKTTL